MTKYLIALCLLLAAPAQGGQLFAAYASVGGTNMVSDPAEFLLPKMEELAPDCIPFLSNPFGSNSLMLSDQQSWTATVELMQEQRFLYHHPKHDFRTASERVNTFWERAHKLLDDHPELDCMVIQLGSPLFSRGESERHVRFAYGPMWRPDGRMVPCADAIGNAPSGGKINHLAWVNGTSNFPHRAWEPGLYHRDGEAVAPQTEREWSYFRYGWAKLNGEWFATPEAIRASGARVFIRSERNAGTNGWEEDNIRLIREITKRWGPLDGSIVPVLTGSVEQIRAAMDWYQASVSPAPGKVTFEELKTQVGEQLAVEYTLFIMHQVPQTQWSEYVDGNRFILSAYEKWFASRADAGATAPDPVAPSGEDLGPGAGLHRPGTRGHGRAWSSLRGRSGVSGVPDRRQADRWVSQVAHGGQTRTPNRRRSPLQDPSRPQDLLDSLRHPTSWRQTGSRSS